MKKFRVSIMIAAFLILGNAAICFAKDAAMVVGFKKGEAHYKTGDHKGREVTLLDFLKPGDTIRLKSGTMMVLNYFDPGVREEISGPGTIIVGSHGSEKSGQVRIRSSKTDYLPSKAVLRQGDVQQTGADLFRTRGLFNLEKIAILSLANTRIRFPQPVFRWDKMETAERYFLKIYNVLGRLHSETAITENRFSYDKPDLARGEDQRYSWTVSAMANGKAFAEGKGKFSILDEKHLNEVTRAETKVKAELSEDSDELLITLAMIYWAYELNDEAASVVKVLQQMHPGNRENIDAWCRKSVSAAFRER